MTDSIYNKLRERGYNARIWPSEYANIRTKLIYDGAIAPFIDDSTTET